VMQIPGAQAVIVDSNGEEVVLASGTFRLAKITGPRGEMAVLFVGEAFNEMSEDSFYYPMIADTPVYMSHKNVLTVSAGDGDVFGIRLPKKLPGGVEEKQALIELMSPLCSFEVADDPDTADKLASYITKGGKKVASGVEKAGQLVTQGLSSGGALARSKIGKKEQETQLGDVTKVSVSSAKFVTGSTVAVATAVVDGLMDTALLLGQEIGKAAGTSPKDPAQKEKSVVRVGKAAGVAGLQVFEQLVNAGDRIVDTACEETAATVAHRYGKDAGDVTRDGLSVGRDVKTLNDMVGKKALKRLAQKGAMYTAKGMITGEPAKQMSSPAIPAAAPKDK